jgi:voltage-gated potassium channel
MAGAALAAAETETAAGPPAALPAPTNAQVMADFVATAAALFLAAEQEHNPSVRTYWDALHYISTSLSVGYANIFPVTQWGKAIGAVVQMVGPALSSKALDAPPAAPEAARADPEMLQRLDAILEELRRQR